MSDGHPPLNAREEIAEAILNLNANRSELIRKMWNARNFGRMHSAETEFERRVAHLVRLAKKPQFTE
jgi:hypothetical protein